MHKMMRREYARMRLHRPLVVNLECNNLDACSGLDGRAALALACGLRNASHTG
ncbi:hypothetical protein SAMN02745121_07748 [Nannocystis exedens]|uniref:Uncharacterized protein n=1 Tax=Nannocystis exedens TaxID=54 RepID=A0A1I2H7C7_9BACT|nr:hypothetical protein NAEX_08944 [Nannocystis exedens]SFF25468.1 hypothetical protein SAMN02745121_07748 [Nannocystis exedens]